MLLSCLRCRARSALSSPRPVPAVGSTHGVLQVRAGRRAGAGTRPEASAAAQASSSSKAKAPWPLTRAPTHSLGECFCVDFVGATGGARAGTWKCEWAAANEGGRNASTVRPARTIVLHARSNGAIVRAVAPGEGLRMSLEVLVVVRGSRVRASREMVRSPPSAPFNSSAHRECVWTLAYSPPEGQGSSSALRAAPSASTLCRGTMPPPLATGCVAVAALAPACLTAPLLVIAALQASAFMIAAGVAAAALAGRAILRQARAGGSVFSAFGGAFGNTIGAAHKVFAYNARASGLLYQL